MPKRVIDTELLMKPIAHFSHATRVGDTVYVGATAGTDPSLRLAGSSPGRVDAVAQSRRMLENLETALGLLGARLEHVKRVKTYLGDVRDLPAYTELFEAKFAGLHPCHSVVGSWGFPLPQAAVELEALAVIGAEAPPGRRHYCTAQPLDGAGALVSGDVAAQCDAALAHLTATLERAGLRPADVVNLHVTLADARDFPVLEDRFKRIFRRPYPSRTIVAAPLAAAAMRLHIECVAAPGGGRPVGAAGAEAGLGCASPAMLAGEELYVSGQVGLGADTGSGVEAQTRAAWARVRALLEATGMGTEAIVRTNNVLTDWRSYAEFNAGYGASVSSPYPPRATVLGGLLDRGAGVQIEALAHVRGADAVVLEASGDAQR